MFHYYEVIESEGDHFFLTKKLGWDDFNRMFIQEVLSKKRHLLKAIKEDRNRDIFSRYYDHLINPDNKITYKELGQEYGISAARVRQIAEKGRRIVSRALSKEQEDKQVKNNLSGDS